MNNRLIGPDHKASLHFKDFKIMVDKIRNIEKSLGSGVKDITQSEKNIPLIRKSIFAKTSIKKGIYSLKTISLLKDHQEVCRRFCGIKF